MDEAYSPLVSDINLTFDRSGSCVHVWQGHATTPTLPAWVAVEVLGIFQVKARTLIITRTPAISLVRLYNR